MDANLKATIRKEGKNTSSAVDLDDDWASIQSKIQDIMGPIGVAWGTLQCHTTDPPEIPVLNKEDMINLTKQLQMGAKMVAHAIQKVSYYRRLHCLSSMVKTPKNVREVLKEEPVKKILLEDASNLLVPPEFDSYLKSKETLRKNIANAFASTKKKENKPAAAKGKPPCKKQPFLQNPHPRGGGNHHYNDRWDDYNRDRGHSNPFARGNRYGGSNYRG